MRIFSILFCLVGFISFAQTDVIANSNFQTNSSNMTYGTGAWAKSKPLDTSIQGSEYLFPSWDGNFLVTSKQGNQYKLFNLNYNLNTKKFYIIRIICNISLYIKFIQILIIINKKINLYIYIIH